ncbi:hypothetical protein NECAME_10998 [Necator americanus]|uniref:Uncharacterized protein n=1 Tax=Necator americanus TaxID=51031 RepID=W2T6A4_NECAM|nr:hypothetical protein NECAME_10998 [Necator americanus]ETN77540.1 hypothetical protein NECAME_10998 [Necator americanus]
MISREEGAKGQKIRAFAEKKNVYAVGVIRINRILDSRDQFKQILANSREGILLLRKSCTFNKKKNFYNNRHFR